MIIMGIDPGTAASGYGIIEQDKKGALKVIHYDNIKTLKEHLMQDRLLKIYTSTMYLVEKYKPDIFVIESLFFNTNAKTAISVGQARGVYMLVAAQNKLPVFEYTALQAKMVLTGYGRSSKPEVRDKVAECLNIKTKITPIDASDALAMALCYTIKNAKS